MMLRRLFLTAGVLAALAAGAEAQTPPAPPRPPPPAPIHLPADHTTHHTVTLPGGRTLAFSATAGSLKLTNAQGVPEAEIAFIAYQLDGADPATRPVSFAINGGPGSSSAWLQLGALGPWRMSMHPDDARPAAPVTLVDNAETWLGFTDLVFLDPVGTGYSHFLSTDEAVRKRIWSVNGDVDGLAEVIRHWLQTNQRLVSPKYLVGESYSGLRAPRLLRALTSEQGIGISGLVLVSPIFDYGGNSAAFDPLSWVYALPTMVAAARARHGPVTHTDMADVEAYAGGEYLTDLMRGDGDTAALERRIAKLAGFTGLDPALLRERRGHENNFEYLHDRDRAESRIGSPYDITVTIADPFPAQAFSNAPDPMTEALNAPFTSAMIDLTSRRLGWPVDANFELTNYAVNRAWDWGGSRARPESLTALRTALALDPHLHVLVTHGLFDFITPYFRSKVLLDQIAPTAGADRLRLLVLPGGHMFYSRDESRIALRDAAAGLYPN
jgi:carboxypeptidase C (cathepsin A)